MIEKPYEIVILKLQDLSDLIDLARAAPASREGQNWANHAMHEGNKAMIDAEIRYGMAADWLYG